jgi:Double zinc ribbon
VKTARFFCESCGRAVPFNAEMCPHCGKSFDAVKCPVCNYTGLPGEFLRGCPKCGYLAGDADPAGDAPAAKIRTSASRRRRRGTESGEELFRDESSGFFGGSGWAYSGLLVLLFGILVAMAVFLFL